MANSGGYASAQKFRRLQTDTDGREPLRCRESIAVACVHLESIRDDDTPDSELKLRAARLIAKDFAEELQRIDHRVLNGAARNCKGSRAVEVRDAQVEIDLEIVARIPGGESGDVESLE